MRVSILSLTIILSAAEKAMSVCELKEHHTDATETVNNLCNKLRQKRLQLLNTDVLGGADWYLLTPTLIWKVSKPSLVRQIHLSVWFLSARASQNNQSRKIKELDKKLRHKLREKTSARMKLLQELVPDCDKCVGRSILTGKLQA
ncbi:hypothetical protein HID58_041281 [Brassica napus]|uniref:Uncharacterized protein n=1 Tax=Brassica napus TaxID=3708 RepID=A0ABQ8BBM3_BRANA|nr:hypothetical protein HID58_041281 [Brassica napus]